MRRLSRICYYGGLACILIGVGACFAGGNVDFFAAAATVGIIAVFAGLLLNLVRMMFSDD